MTGPARREHPPDFAAERSVDAGTVTDFRERGHCCVPAVLSPDEVEAVAPTLVAAAREHNLEGRPLAERDVYGQAFLQTINLWLTHPIVRAFVLAPRFAHLAATLLGVESVRLYHDQALVKEAGGGHTPWHQDQFYWPLDTDLTVTMWMPLADLDPAVGSMRFASGSHRYGFLGDLPIGEESDTAFERVITQRGLTVDTHGPLAAGDATFHTGWTLHSAGANHTDADRPAMTVIFFADGARVGALDHPNRRLDRALYLPGLEEGDLAASPFTPRLWPPCDDGPPAPPVRDAAYWADVAAAAREAGVA